MSNNELIRVLTEVFERRKAKNPRYSLRAFAKSLQMHSATLSRLLTGKRRLTSDQALKILDRLQVDDARLRLRMIEANRSARTPVSKPKTFTEVDLEHFAVIRDWQHTAILCALEIKPTSTPASISRQLGVTVDVVDESIARLERVGLLRKTARGWKLSDSHHATAPAKIPNSHLQECNRQYLEKARESLEKFSFEDREHCGITMTVNPERLPLLRQAMREFLERVAALADDGKPQDIYRLNLQLFPLIERGFE